MRLENDERPCWFVATDTIYLAGPFYTDTQASNYLTKCTDNLGYANIRLEGVTYAIERSDIFIIRDINWS